MSASNMKKETTPAPEQDEYDRKLKEAGAYTILSPAASAANAIGDLNRDINLNGEGVTGVDVKTLAAELNTQNKAIFKGDLQRIEAMLLDQAHVLQSISVSYVQKMARAEYTEHIEVFSRIALRAQNQCRQTLATLGELKNPKRSTFIKQQNNAVNQQINQDGNQTEIQKNSDNSSNELEELANEQLDPRAAQAPCRVNKEMGAVASVHRTSVD